ncbi:uncharacterized protein LACBIDRAFT_318802 [Laccaria bicolor S238N-H82]|uniref:Predicted protein n=1 Tax=Laccaria bicolor (strain S238N-H82 / ATCC MYA-4686) TaxID=486041 RepID=B0D744_LACBS|nr:uncharacterized protein LACBIDRAFT_318802 [Laccaria bicolor S238N-H82]EDR09586.1 predicted protein [Laccaria bicolor S238N-H82]|eukprot:XP_001879935.1 predicted protein [Laccaria bicolor S238N-H82]
MKLSTPLLLLSAAVLGALAQESTTSSTLSIRSHVLPSGGPYTKTSGSYTLPTTTGSQTTPLPTSTTITTSATSTGTPTVVPTTLPTTSTTTSPLPSSTLSTTSTGSRTSSSSSSTSATTSSKPSSGALSMTGLEGGNYVLAALLSSLLFFL